MKVGKPLPHTFQLSTFHFQLKPRVPTVCATASIQAAPEDIFSFLADYRNIPQVQPQFTSARLTSERERCAGACVELIGRFHGVPMRVQNRIITYAPPNRLASISEGTVLSRSVWELKSVPSQSAPSTTCVTLTVDYKVGGALGGLFTGITSAIFHNEIQAMTNESLCRLQSFFTGDGK